MRRIWISSLKLIMDDRHNGITLCTGSLGCSAKERRGKTAGKYAAMGRIHFAHLKWLVLDNGFEKKHICPAAVPWIMFGDIVKAWWR